eukprot:3819355-Prymnesium_polylepis.1
MSGEEHGLGRFVRPFDAKRPLHPVAFSFVGSARTLWLPFMAHALLAYFPTDVDVFMTVSLSDPSQGADAHAQREGVAATIKRLQPVHVHILHKLTCENETARVEL